MQEARGKKQRGSFACVLHLASSCICPGVNMNRHRWIILIVVVRPRRAGWIVAKRRAR
jgi:hypothetical protein